MLFQRFTAWCTAVAVLLVGVRAAADPVAVPADVLRTYTPPWLVVPADLLVRMRPAPVLGEPILTFGPRPSAVRSAKGNAVPDEMTVPPLLGGIDLGYDRLRFGPIEPNCMINYSLTQKFLNPKVSRDARRAWAMLNDEPFPMNEPEFVSSLRSIISPGITYTLNGVDNLGIGLRTAPDLGLHTYCASASFIHRF